LPSLFGSQFLIQIGLQFQDDFCVHYLDSSRFNPASNAAIFRRA
jgi:hypothetical protein